MAAEVSVIIVSYNTRDLTLKAIETLRDNAGKVSLDIIVWDNASEDGSAQAIAERFPDIIVHASAENLGFGKANNAAAEGIETPWVVLLNSDTETYPGAIENLLHFAKANPDAGIVGGRAFFPDGSPNVTSCFSRMTLWGLLSTAIGLHHLFPNSRFFNGEMIGGWQRDTVRQVDVISGSFMMMPTPLWRKLGGFNPRYFMYAEDLDISMRARKLGYRPMVTPTAKIMHLGGASAARREEKMVQMFTGRSSLLRDHWHPALIPVGLVLLQLYVLTRLIGARVQKALGKPNDLATFRGVWARRKLWRKGY